MKKIKMFAKNVFKPNRMKMAALMLLCGTVATFAQNSAGDYTAGTNALSTVTEEIAKYIPYVVKLCYAIAGVVAVVGAISVYIAMNNEEQDVEEEDHDGRRCLHLPGCSCTGPSSVLRTLTIRQNRLNSGETT